MASTAPDRARPTAAPARPSRAPRPRGTARRRALLDATLALVGEVGVDAVTHRAVARRADLPLASTTYWFDSKEQLLTEALRYAADRDGARLRDAAHAAMAGAARSGDPAAAPVSVAAIVEVLLDADAGTDPAAERGPQLAAYTLMLEAARRPALQAIARRWTESYLTTIGDLLRRAGSTRPAADARLLMAAFDGLLVDRLATGAPDDGDMAPELRRLLEALLGAPR